MDRQRGRGLRIVPEFRRADWLDDIAERVVVQRHQRQHRHQEDRERGRTSRRSARCQDRASREARGKLTGSLTRDSPRSPRAAESRSGPRAAV